MFLYKDSVFLESKRDADDLYKLLKDNYDRNLALNIPVEGFNYGFNNVMYSEYDNKFYIAYENKDFRDLHYGESRTFYVPDWAVVIYNFKNQERYKELEDYKLPWKKYTIRETSGRLFFDGFYKYTKQDKGIGRLDGLDFVLDSDEKMQNMEDMLIYQSILDVDSLTFKFTMSEVFNVRTIDSVVFWRIMQRNNWHRFNVNAYLSIIQIDNFFSNYAFIHVSSYHPWLNDAPITNVYINRSMKGKKDFISRFSNLKYVPRSLTIEESMDYLSSVFNKKSHWDIVDINLDKSYMMIQSIYGAKFKLILL